MKTTSTMQAGIISRLRTFKIRTVTAPQCLGTYIIRAISHETGEIRTYQTREESDIRFICNSDFIAYEKEKTQYIVAVVSTEGSAGVRIIYNRIAQAGTPVEKHDEDRDTAKNWN